MIIFKPINYITPKNLIKYQTTKQIRKNIETLTGYGIKIDSVTNDLKKINKITDKFTQNTELPTLIKFYPTLVTDCFSSDGDVNFLANVTKISEIVESYASIMKKLLESDPSAFIGY